LNSKVQPITGWKDARPGVGCHIWSLGRPRDAEIPLCGWDSYTAGTWSQSPVSNAGFM